jgi:hypothetical protein
VRAALPAPNDPWSAEDVLDGLKALLAKGGYKVYFEYPIHFKSRIRKSGDWISRDGKLDLVAVKNGRRVAIEFDTGVRLKFKSIEKLFQVDADLRIGIIRGKLNKSGNLDMNIERFEKLTKEFRGFKNKSLGVLRVNNHQLKLVALPYSGFACLPLAVISIHQLKQVVLKSEE